MILVMGCYSQCHAQKCAELGADIVLGASMRSKALPYIEQFLATKQKIIDVKKTLRHEEYEELSAPALCENARAYLKIQDGCDNFCAYCYIPTLRGNSRSRDPRNVLNEAYSLYCSGYKEIVLTGIHIGGYGKDLGDGSYRLGDLIDDIFIKCPSLFRLRISSIEESEIDEALLRALSSHPSIADHLHIPLQSGSEAVLKAMKRHYDKKAFLGKLALIRAIRPDIAITTDVIAGYPGETKEQWEETVAFCREAQFAEIHVFPFSSRPNTYAATLIDTPPEIKKARVAELLALSKSMRLEYEKRFYGQKMDALVEQIDEKGLFAIAHTSNYLLVKIPSSSFTPGDVANITYSNEIASD